MWLAMGQYFASNFTFFFCLTWLFPYLQRTYQLEALQTGLLAALPLVGGAIGNWVGGAIVDSLYRRGRWRAVASAAGDCRVSCLSAAGLLGQSGVSDPIPAVLCLTLAMFGADMTLPPSWAFCIDIGRAHAGAVSGTMNMAGNIGSFVTSLAFPYLLAHDGIDDAVLCRRRGAEPGGGMAVDQGPSRRSGRRQLVTERRPAMMKHADRMYS